MDRDAQEGKLNLGEAIFKLMVSNPKFKDEHRALASSLYEKYRPIELRQDIEFSEK